MTVQAAVPSPCIDVCRMDAHSGLCEGCQRTLAEIATWSSMSDDDKREVWRRLELRSSVCAPSGLGATGGSA